MICFVFSWPTPSSVQGLLSGWCQCWGLIWTSFMKNAFTWSVNEFFVCFGAPVGGAQNLILTLLRAHSWWGLSVHMPCWGSNTHKLHDRQMPYQWFFTVFFPTLFLSLLYKCWFIQCSQFLIVAFQKENGKRKEVQVIILKLFTRK